MWMLILEAGAALLLLLLIVWWTMFAGNAPDPGKQPDPAPVEHDAARKTDQ